ncbi:MAG: SDR family oxidoreductase, partial [Proteobacteria bacterium]|nr:SDR family oxidoreductase [Pseudomonadota bacterium]
MSESRRLFCFGLGYTGLALARACLAEGWTVAGTCRAAARRDALAAEGIDAWLFDENNPLADPAEALAGATHMLASAPPGEAGDGAAFLHGGAIAATETLGWIGYLSTTGVYGDHAGGWVDEDSPLAPTSERARRRVAAEEQWLDFWWNDGIPTQIFRLAGIYGPGRGPLAALRAGTAKRIDKPGHLFSRIHLDDITATLRASMARPNGGRVYNVCDDAPAAQAEVVAFAAELLGVEPPPLVPIEDAALSALGLSF